MSDEIQEHISLPQFRIHGQRFGQLLVNAIRLDYKFNLNQEPTDDQVTHILFNIDNLKLEIMLNRYNSSLLEIEERITDGK
jgi:hypothetical protein